MKTEKRIGMTDEVISEERKHDHSPLGIIKTAQMNNYVLIMTDSHD